jgi:hypothetical protein
MKNFMASRSLTRGMEVDEVPNKGETMPFPREDEVMMIYDGSSSPRMCRMSNPSPGTPTHYGWGCRDARMLGHKFSNNIVH